MRVTYNVYSHKKGDQEVDEDLHLWLSSWMRVGGIESELVRLRELVILFTEDMLVEHPERIDRVVDILDAGGTDHKIVEEGY